MRSDFASTVCLILLIVCILNVTSIAIVWKMKSPTIRSTKEGVRWKNRPQPNIVFLLADDLGYNDVGYHNPAMKTENIDRLAGDGVRLENYYVQPVCSPTRSQLLSGRYQIHTGLQHSIIWVTQPTCHPLSDPTLADKLRQAGYSTHAVGKWHMGYYKKQCWPTYRGFDSFFGMLTGSGNYYTHQHTGGHHSLPQSKNWSGYDLRDNVEQVARDYQGVYSTHLFTNKSQEIIRKHNTSKPLFLYHSFQAVHHPLQVPPKYTEDFDYIPSEKRRIFAGMVRCLDEAVGNITESLREKGILNNTIIIFSSDNGGNHNYGGNNWPLRGMKRSLWEGGIKAVGFVSSPLLPRAARGTINRDLFHVTDWFPTLVKGVARGSVKRLDLDGFNVWKYLTHPSKRRKRNKGWPRKEILHNIDPYTPKSAELPQRFTTFMPAAIRYDNWKLLTSERGNGSWIAPPESNEVTVHPSDRRGHRVWLFNLKDDPNETNDLSLDRMDVAVALLRRLGSYLRGSVPVFYPGSDIRANPALHNNSWSDWVHDEIH